MQSRPKVLSLQNGLGNGELLAESLPADRIFTGVTTYGATSLSDCEVAARGEGELVVGGWFGDQQLYSNELAKLFAEAGWKVRIGQNMRQEVWKKALVNIGINPVTAIYRVTNGEILQRKELQELASAAVKEAEEAAFAAGILSIENVGHAVSRMLAVCSQTATNHSSMLQDIEKGRRTEIDALNGSIVQLGEACAVNTPVNRELVRQIKTLEQNTSF
jgi:2-dehydropantoate 2-reductase